MSRPRRSRARCGPASGGADPALIRASDSIYESTMTRWSAVVSLVLFVGGCDILENAPCSGAVGSCTGRSEALFCLDGRFTRIRCDGPAGCSEVSGNFRCDQSVGAASDRCATESSAACTADHQSYLICENGRYVLSARCRGQNHCRVEGGRVLCDETVAEVNDPCVSDTAGAACSSAGDAWLRCTDGRFTTISACRGPAGCHVDGSIVRCDQSIAVLGDACASEGGGACTADRSTMLFCRNGAYGAPRACRGPGHCAIEAGQVHCDQSIAAVGDACGIEGGYACDVSGRRRLVCSGGTLSPDRACSRGCTARDGQIFCD